MEKICGVVGEKDKKMVEEMRKGEEGCGGDKGGFGLY